MRALRGVFVLVLVLALPTPVLAADYQAGCLRSLEPHHRSALANHVHRIAPMGPQRSIPMTAGIIKNVRD